jgi:hypothetical protein
MNRAEQVAERVRMALAETEYIGAAVDVVDEGDEWIVRLSTRVPDEVAWHAACVANPGGVPCWECWSSHDMALWNQCVEGQCPRKVVP